MIPSLLKLVSLRHCYVQLPQDFINSQTQLKVGSIVCLRSVQRDTELLVIWNGQPSKGAWSELDVDFARANQFSDEVIVISVSSDVDPPGCTYCRVELIDSSDYAILRQHSDANVLDNCKLVCINNVVPIWLSEHVKVMVRVVHLEPDSRFGWLTRWTEMHYEHSLNQLPEDPKRTTMDELVPIEDPISFVSISLAHECENPTFAPISVLVYGDRGSGKTYYLKSIADKYKRYYFELFNCKQIRGKRPESAKKLLIELADKALANEPSVIGLDDLDAFVASDDAKHAEDTGQEAIYRARLLDCYIAMIKHLERSEKNTRKRVLVVATSRSLDSLDKKLVKPLGRTYFHTTIKLEPPSSEKRLIILKCLTSRLDKIECTMNDQDFEDVAKKSETYMPIDLERLVERAVIRACSRSLSRFNSEPTKIEVEDMIGAIEGHIPSSLRSVTLRPKTKRQLSDVGGMAKVKEALMKTILLPLKYPKLYAKFPIRMQNSVLLFGPPGCGKTLVAEAVSNCEGLNSISIRGPELLSKYIGASEAAVVSLFKRAEAARPCVIFFDEFESLVPKRGSDSTGVTDRVVNQFLTLMDGAERLSERIFIIGATSRPDMIDPAVLRPGRLDKHVYCGPPDENDRYEILQIMCTRLTMSPDVDLKYWAQRLEWFTGSDIQALLYAAQLMAFHSVSDDYKRISMTSSECQETGDSHVEVANDDDDVVRMSIRPITIMAHHLAESFSGMRDEVAARCEKLLRNYPTTLTRQIPTRVATRATLA